MIQILSLLLRPKLALLNGVSAVGGYLLMPGNLELKFLFATFFGVALLAAGGSVFNQVLEMDLDRLMVRTSQRPLPQGRFTQATALVIGITVVVIGLGLIGTVGEMLPLLLGITALLWYLAIYTPLKQRTPFAIAIGGVCGALPPVIGWSMAGGDPTDFRVILLAGLLYLWQIPHFWFLQRRYAEDYRKIGIELPCASGRPSGLMGLWITALVAAAMLLPALRIIENHVAIWYMLFFLPLIAMVMLRSEKLLVYYFNLFPLLIAIILGAQRC